MYQKMQHVMDLETTPNRGATSAIFGRFTWPPPRTGGGRCYYRGCERWGTDGIGG